MDTLEQRFREGHVGRRAATTARGFVRGIVVATIWFFAALLFFVAFALAFVAIYVTHARAAQSTSACGVSADFARGYFAALTEFASGIWVELKKPELVAAYLKAVNEAGEGTAYTADAIVIAALPGGTASIVLIRDGRGCERIFLDEALHTKAKQAIAGRRT